MEIVPSTSGNPVQKTVVVHLHYQHLWGEIAEAIKRISPDRLYVTTTGTLDSITRIQMQFPRAEIFKVENRGRDIYPLVLLSNLGKFDDDSIVWKLHSKKSVHTLRGNSWRRELFEAICGSETRVDLVAMILRAGEISMVGADKYLNILSEDNLADHRERFMTWNGLLGGSRSLSGIPYFAGTIFACKSQVLSDLKRLQLKESDFFLENHEKDLFGKSFAISLYVLNMFRRISFLSRIRAKLDIRTRPASKKTYALEAFIGQLALNYGEVKGIDELLSEKPDA